MKKIEIDHGKYKSLNANGVLKEIICVEDVGKIPFRSIHYKIIVDGSNEELLATNDNGKLIDSKGSEWVKILL